MEVVLWKYHGSDRVEKKQSFSFRDVHGVLHKIHVEQQQDAICHSGGVWDSAVCLCEWACSVDWKNYKELSVLELGAGTGLLSILLFKLLACSESDGRINVTATDLPDALPILRENLKLNYADGVVVKELTWGTSLSDADYSLVFLADCVFGEFDLGSLLSTLRSLKKGTRLVFGYKPRMKNKEDAFFRKLGGVRSQIETPAAYLSTNVQIFQILL